MNKLQPRLASSDVEILDRQVCHRRFLKVDLLTLRHRRHEGGWIGPMERELLVKDQAVGVLLYDPERDEIVMVRQFRVGVMDEKSSPWLLELVAGMVDKDESHETVACRESEEEANLKPRDLIKISDYYNSPGTSNERVILFCGRVDANEAGGVFGLDDEFEDIEVVTLSCEQAAAGVNDGSIDNAMSIIAIQWLLLNKSQLQQRWLGEAE